MAEEVIIKTVLDLTGSEQSVKRQVEKALSSPDVQARAKEAGRKIGEAMSLGIETTRRSRENKEEQHQRRLEVISSQSAVRIQQIEARKQAQLEVIRERAFQKEIEHQRKLERAVQSASGGVSGFRSAIAGISGVFASLAAVGVVSFFESVGRRALDAAISINQQVNTLKALTGSAEAAQKRFEQLFALAQKTPGLTTSLALTLDTQLRVFNVAAQTIDNLLPVIGKLNAIAPLGNPRQFVNNLTQLITRNFDREDLKELASASPIAGNLIKEVFNVDNPTNAEAIRAAAKRLGITTVERLAEELVKAAETNSALKNATESLGSQFDRLQDRLTVALAPLGEQLAKVLIPIFDDLVKQVEKYGTIAADVFRENKNDIIATAKEITAMAIEVGKLIGQIARVGAQSGIFRFLGRSAGAIQDIINDPFSLEFVGPRERAAIARFDELDAEAAAVRNSPFLGSVPRQIAPPGGAAGEIGGRPRRAAGGGEGRSGGTGAAAQLARERAREIKQLQEQLLKARIDDFADTTIGALSEIERTITGANLSNISRKPARAGEATTAGAGALTRFHNIQAEIAALGVHLSNAERFMLGFRDATESVGDAFERFGSNVARAFTNVRDLFNELKRAVLGFFNDLLGSALQDILRGTLGQLFGGSGLFKQSTGGGISPLAFVGFGSGFGIETGAGGKGFALPSGQSIATAVSLFGLQLGISLGGQSTAGRILGGIGGGLGITSVIGAPLFAAGALLGRGKQRRSDEEASGEFLRQALAGIEQLMSGISSGSVNVTQARSIFESQILGTFIQQINTLKTKSVRESRLKNQVQDLRNVFESRLPGALAQQQQLQANALAFSRQIPEFASGGLVPGVDRGFDNVRALLRPGEMVLTRSQQASIMAQSNPGVFDRAGVPRTSIQQGGSQAFALGGVAQATGFGQPIEITLDAQILIGKNDATRIVVVGASTPQGRAVTVKNVSDARTNREL